MRFEVRCKQELQEARILKVPKPLRGVSAGKVPMVEDSVQNATTAIDRKKCKAKVRED